MIAMELYEIKNLCCEMAELGAARYQAKLTPAKDLISQRQAYEEYGEALVKGWVRNELVTPVRAGAAKNSPLKYSRADLMSCREAEKLNYIFNQNQSN